MKVSHSLRKSFLTWPGPDPAIVAVLLYGPDKGQMVEVMNNLTEVVAKNHRDPFLVSNLTAKAVQSHPDRLITEVLTPSWIGGRRIIRIHEADDTILEPLEYIIKYPRAESLIIVIAGVLNRTSKLRCLFENALNAAAFPCYQDSNPTLEALIKETFLKFNIKIEQSVVVYLTGQMGNDRLQSRRELEKLVLYAQANNNLITLEDAIACTVNSSDSNMDNLVSAVADGNQEKVSCTYARILSDGMSPIGVLRSVLHFLQKVYFISSTTCWNSNKEQVFPSLKLALTTNSKDVFLKYLSAWPCQQLAEALATLTQAEVECKTIDGLNRIICERALLQLVRVGRNGTVDSWENVENQR